MHINQADLAKVIDAMQSGIDFFGGADREELEEAMKILRKVEANTATDEQLDAAREQYANDECEIDDDAATSEADKGYWVQAWVWIENQEGEDAEV